MSIAVQQRPEYSTTFDRDFLKSFRMWLAARLLLLVRKQIKNATATLFDVLAPEYFDHVAEHIIRQWTAADTQTLWSENYNLSTLHI